MPPRAVFGTGLLHEQLVVQEIDLLAVEELRRQRGQMRLQAKSAEVGIVFPNPQIAVETAFTIRRIIAVHERPRVGDIPIDRRLQPRTPGRIDDIAHDHRTVTVERVLQARINFGRRLIQRNYSQVAIGQLYRQT